MQMGSASLVAGETSEGVIQGQSHWSGLGGLVGQIPLKLKKLIFCMSTGSNKFASLSAFCKLESQAPDVTNSLRPLLKS